MKSNHERRGGGWGFLLYTVECTYIKYSELYHTKCRNKIYGEILENNLPQI